MALSEAAKRARADSDRKYWLRKCQAYGIKTEGRENEAIKEARRIYNNDYWERKARGEI